MGYYSGHTKRDKKYKMNKEDIQAQVDGIKQWPNVVDAWIQDDLYVNVLLKDVKMDRRDPKDGAWIHERVQMCFDMSTIQAGYFSEGAVNVVGSNPSAQGIGSATALNAFGGHVYMCLGGGPWTNNFTDAFKKQDVVKLVGLTTHFIAQHKDYYTKNNVVSTRAWNHSYIPLKRITLPGNLTTAQGRKELYAEYEKNIEHGAVPVPDNWKKAWEQANKKTVASQEKAAAERDARRRAYHEQILNRQRKLREKRERLKKKKVPLIKELIGE